MSQRRFVLSVALLSLAASCDALVLLGAGASFPNWLFQGAADAYLVEKVSPGVTVSYTSMTSERGHCRIMGWEAECDADDDAEPRVVDFGATDSLLTEAEYALYPDLEMYPLAASAVVPIYNLPGFTWEDPPLVLTPGALSAIFSSNLTRWDDYRIAVTNPMLAAAGKLQARDIVVVVPSISTGTTEIFKRALRAFDPTGFGAQVGASPEPDWPGATVVPCDGDPLGISSCVLATPFSMGFVVLSDVQADVLPAVHLLMPGVPTPLRATVEGAPPRSARCACPRHPSCCERATLTVLLPVQFAAAFSVRNTHAEHRTVDLHDARGLTSWPISGATYLVMRTNTSLFPANSGECERRQEVTLFSLSFTLSFYRYPLTHCHIARHVAAKLL